MDADKKSFIKSTIMGILGGGSAAAIYALNKAREDEKEDKEYREGVGKNHIIVPLSKKRFMTAVRSKNKSKDNSEYSSNNDAEKVDKSEPIDVSMMSPRDIALLKKTILNKRGSCKSVAPTEIKEKTSPVSMTSGIRKNSKKSDALIRDKKGRFASAESLGKQAGVIDDANGIAADFAGFVGGATLGSLSLKMLVDKILVNRKKRQVAYAKRTYANMINKEVNDEDEPYYTSRTKSAADHRSFLGEALGLAGVAGVATTGLTAMVVYKVLENRRKEAERKADEDVSKYPIDKSIQFKFAEKNTGKKSFFKLNAHDSLCHARAELKKQAMTSKEHIAFGVYDNILPDSLKGDLAVKGYLHRLFFQNPLKKHNNDIGEFGRKVLKSPGTVSSMYKYLSGNGKKYIPDIVEKELGDHFYTEIFKTLSKTPIGRQIVLSRFLDRTLPSVVGDNNIAREFIAAGGQI